MQGESVPILAFVSQPPSLSPPILAQSPHHQGLHSYTQISCQWVLALSTPLVNSPAWLPLRPKRSTITRETGPGKRLWKEPCGLQERDFCLISWNTVLKRGRLLVYAPSWLVNSSSHGESVGKQEQVPRSMGPGQGSSCSKLEKRGGKKEEIALIKTLKRFFKKWLLLLPIHQGPDILLGITLWFFL